MHSPIHDVTVIIPNFNRVEPLIKAVYSVIFQIEQVKKIIVIDDCSDLEKYQSIEKKLENIKKSTTLEINLVRMEKNSGANLCRNMGISKANTQYIAFLDSDDLWTKDKIKVQMEHIYRAKFQETRPILSCTGRLRVNGDFEIIGQQFSGRVFSYKKLLRSNYLGTLSSVIVDTWIAKFVNGFDESLPACQDWDFFIRLSHFIKYVGVSNPLCIYVDHDEERITSGNKKRIYGHLQIRRNYLKSQFFYSDYSEFFRNLAEDFSELGNEKYAVKYYKHHLQSLEKNNLYRLLKFPLHSIEAKKNWSEIKLLRYEKYREKKVTADVSAFRKWIKKVNIL